MELDRLFSQRKDRPAPALRLSDVLDVCEEEFGLPDSGWICLESPTPSPGTTQPAPSQDSRAE